MVSFQAFDNLCNPFEVLLECGFSFKVKWPILFVHYIVNIAAANRLGIVSCMH